VNDIRTNLENVTRRISVAAERAGRDPSDVLLLAISKTKPAGDVARAAQAGQIHFGENRVQESREKIPQLPDHLVWHLVGHLQSNKAKYCPDLFSWIHSIDSVSLGREVARRYREKGRECKALIQVNVSGEEVKSGCEPGDAMGIISALIEEEGIIPAGLMTMPPFDLDPETARPHFRALRQLRDKLIDEGVPGENLMELSMGMTGDFEVAVEEGSTIVRIGTAIFGARY
jgi:pyridoxal phosphate enzyme (YggS family)